MQYLTLSLALCLCALTIACQRPDAITLQPTIEEPPGLPSAIRVGDPTTSNQFIKGVYELEANSFRWAGPKFSITLGTPPGAASKGAWLVLDFTLPDVSIETLKNITVAAKIGDMTLPPEAFTTEGRHEYRREVPASALAGELVAADFTVDKFLQPPSDGRQLALVLEAVRLETK